MSHYFHVSNGQRGCYLPDSGYVARVESRRELKRLLEYELRDMRDAGYIGATKSAAASLAARAWRTRGKFTLDHVAPLAPAHARGSYCYGLFASAATREEWKTSQEES